MDLARVTGTAKLVLARSWRRRSSPARSRMRSSCRRRGWQGRRTRREKQEGEEEEEEREGARLLSRRERDRASSAPGARRRDGAVSGIGSDGTGPAQRRAGRTVLVGATVPAWGGEGIQARAAGKAPPPPQLRTRPPLSSPATDSRAPQSDIPTDQRLDEATPSARRSIRPRRLPRCAPPGPIHPCAARPLHASRSELPPPPAGLHWTPGPPGSERGSSHGRCHRAERALPPAARQARCEA